MRNMPKIVKVIGREVLDSRGHPTVEVEILLDSGASGRAIAPAGASTGRHEAVELRDQDPGRFQGRGVRKAVQNVNHVIAPHLVGREALDQAGIDRLLLTLDGTPDKSRLGANAMLGVSLAAAKASAAGLGVPLYRYLGGVGARELPVPLINIISGGLHAGQNIGFQDFLIIPLGAGSYREALLIGSNVYQAMRGLLAERGHRPLGVADEGGFGPLLTSNLEALELLVAGIERAGYRPGKEVAVALDVASTHFSQEGRYILSPEGKALTSGEMVDLLERWVLRYPILSIEDGLAEEDWEGWKTLTLRVGRKVQLIGDDLFTTHPERLKRGIEVGAANAILVKVNQIGTLTEALEVVEQARRSGYLPVISARSGETEDATIADLAVATNAGQIKIGSITRSERLAKYNQLLRIEEELREAALYRGGEVFARFFQT